MVRLDRWRSLPEVIVLMDMPPPLLVVEVVSPNQEKRDYRYKRTEYAARGIAEYWIVDPLAEPLSRNSIWN
jgi:Uma2 family endonuclease